MATSVAAIENDAKRVATRPTTLAILSRLGKDRNVTDALNTIAACVGEYLTERVTKVERNLPQYRYMHQ